MMRDWSELLKESSWAGGRSLSQSTAVEAAGPAPAAPAGLPHRCGGPAPRNARQASLRLSRAGTWAGAGRGDAAGSTLDVLFLFPQLLL